MNDDMKDDINWHTMLACELCKKDESISICDYKIIDSKFIFNLKNDDGGNKKE